MFKCTCAIMFLPTCDKPLSCCKISTMFPKHSVLENCKKAVATGITLVTRRVR